MKRSRLRNNFLKSKTYENRLLYTKPRHYSVSLLRKSKKTYFDDLDEKRVTDKKLIWKAVKSSLSNKSFAKDRINVI